jgi:hypothetical protein
MISGFKEAYVWKDGPIQVDCSLDESHRKRGLDLPRLSIVFMILYVSRETDTK